jgi:hypothetical protein
MSESKVTTKAKLRAERAAKKAAAEIEAGKASYRENLRKVLAAFAEGTDSETFAWEHAFFAALEGTARLGDPHLPGSVKTALAVARVDLAKRIADAALREVVFRRAAKQNLSR